MATPTRSKYHWIIFFLYQLAWFWLGASPTLPLLFPENLYWVSAANAIITLGIALLFALSTHVWLHNKGLKNRLLNWVMLYFLWVIFSSFYSDYTWSNPLRVFGFLFVAFAWIIIIFLGTTRLPLYISLVSAMRYYVVGVILTTIVLVSLGNTTSQRFGDADLLHPNSLGFMYAVAFLSITFLPILQRAYRLVFQILFGILLLLTFSKTAVIAALTGYLMGMVWQRGWKRAESLVTLGILMGVVATRMTDYVLDQLQRYLSNPYLVTTLSGRTEIWLWVFEMIERRPWIGYGYASFRDLFAPYTYYYGIHLPSIAHPHNAFIDALFNSGYVGLFLFCIVLFRFLLPIWRTRKIHTISSFTIGIMTLLMIRSLTEAALNLGRDFVFLIYIGFLAETQWYHAYNNKVLRKEMALITRHLHPE